MLPWTALPPELWLAIFDIVLEARVNPADSCTYLNYPEVGRHLRNPDMYAPIEDSYCQLRLVCRAFNALLGPSPYLFMRYDMMRIPNTTRAVYILPFQDSPTCLRRILAEPENARRLTTLHIGYDASENPGEPVPFGFLCEHSHLLPGLRVLGIRICDPIAKSLQFKFWAFLNAAFPRLIILTIRMMREWTSPWFVLATEDDDPMITFNYLEMLDISSVLLYRGLRLPSLRHITFDRCSQSEIERLELSPLLESVMLRGLRSDANLNLSILPNLRLLGIPNDGKAIVRPLPQDHSLSHLCAFLLSPVADFLNLLAWVREVPSVYPGISRLSIDLTLLKATDRLWAEAFFTHTNLQPNGLLVTPFSAGTPQIDIERVLGPFPQNAVSMDTPQSRPTTDIHGLKTIWNRLTRYASFHMNL